MKQILPGVWQWSWFSDEKQLDFNGLLLTIGEHKVLVDPPPMTSEASAIVRRHAPIDYILITNRDHLREASTYQHEFDCRLYVPEADAALIGTNVTKTYKDGELLPGGIWAVHLKDQKSPGESALFIDRGQGILIVGMHSSASLQVPYGCFPRKSMSTSKKLGRGSVASLSTTSTVFWSETVFPSLLVRSGKCHIY